MKMFSSIRCTCINVPITKSPILSCLPTQHSSSSSSSENSSPPPLGSRRKPREAKILTSSSSPLQKKPSVAEIERAIGAGVFRDRDTDSEDKKTLFDTILSNSIGKTEGSVEKKLRETGEWILDKTEGSSSRSAGKNILKAVFLWILPLWIISFLVAAGFVELPFHTKFLDDWIM